MRIQDLSVSRKQLVSMMQETNFGCILGLVVRSGEPVLDPPPRIVREIKFGGENGPRPEAGRADFALKAEVRDLFAQLEVLGDAVVSSLEIKHGLPFKMTVEEGAA